MQRDKKCARDRIRINAGGNLSCGSIYKVILNTQGLHFSPVILLPPEGAGGNLCGYFYPIVDIVMQRFSRIGQWQRCGGHTGKEGNNDDVMKQRTGAEWGNDRDVK